MTAPTSRGKASIDVRIDPCPQTANQLAPWSLNVSEYSRYVARPIAIPPAHRSANAGQYHQLRALRFSQAQAEPGARWARSVCRRAS